MIVYYAHCQAIYGSKQEERDLYMMMHMFNWVVLNPADEKYKEGWKAHGMGYAERLIEQTEALIFRALPDGRIPAGVAKEIKIARDLGLPVLELPSRATSRTISVDETREYLREIGQR